MKACFPVARAGTKSHSTVRKNGAPMMSALGQSRSSVSFDHLVCAREQGRRQFNAHCSRRSQVDAEVELGGAVEGQVARLFAFQHAIKLRNHVLTGLGEIRP